MNRILATNKNPKITANIPNPNISVDKTEITIDGNTSITRNENMKMRMESIDFKYLEADGHNYDEIKNALHTAKNTKGKPTAIIAKSIKGKGVSFMENEAGWHGMAPNEEQYNIAANELLAKLNELEGR